VFALHLELARLVVSLMHLIEGPTWRSEGSLPDSRIVSAPALSQAELASHLDRVLRAMAVGAENKMCR
jgi:hypothetical protein